MITRLLLLLALLAPVSAQAEGQAGEVAAVVAEGWRHCVWSVYPVEKVKADDALPTTRKAEGVELRVAGGEYEPFLLVLRPEVPLREVRVECSALAGPDGATIAASECEVRRVAYVYLDEPSGARIKQPMPFETGTGLHPDPLPRGDGAVRPGRNLQFWITAHVPRDARPGRYAGTVALRFRREGWMPTDFQPEVRVPLVVHVRRFALPERSPLLNAAFFDVRALGEGRRDPQWLRALYRDFAAHRQVAQPVIPAPQITVEKDGRLTIDTTAWEAETAFCLDELHASHLFIPVRSLGGLKPTLQGFDFLFHYPAVTKQWWFGTHIAREDRTLTPEFRERFGQYLRHMHGVLQRRGWLDRAFVTTMDEPYTYHLSGPERAQDTPENNYEVIRNLVAFIRETAPGLKTYCTADPAPGLTGSIDHWALRNLQHADAARIRAEQHGEVVTVCDNYRTFVDYPLVAPRTLGWLAWKVGARGWLTYETLGGFDTAWEGPGFMYPIFSGGSVWGMGQFFYPDTTSRDLVPSIRWEMMREGAEDYECLWLLRQRLAALSPAEQNSPTARQAAQLLSTAAGEIVGGSGDPETASATPKPNTQSNAAVLRLREQVAELIEKLTP